MEPSGPLIGLYSDRFTLNQYVKTHEFGGVSAKKKLGTIYLNVTVIYSAFSRAVRHTAASNIHKKTQLTDPRNITYSTYPGNIKKPSDDTKEGCS